MKTRGLITLGLVAVMAMLALALAGCQGGVGPKGDQGSPGAAGIAGPTGPAGPEGAAGIAGPAGPAGAKGVTGAAGPAGATGAAGPAGPAGAKGATGATGATGPAGPAGAAAVAVSLVQPESCTTCHSEAGAKHQASYDELYQDGVIAVTNLAYANNGTTETVSFKMTKAGASFDCRDADSIGIYFTAYTGTRFEQAARLSLTSGATKAYDGAGGCTYTKAQSSTGNLAAVKGLLVVYGRDEDVARLPARVYQNKYPFAAVLETGTGVDYVSAANAAGCEKCHTVPYLKHSYIYAQVNHDPATDFYTCKGCHLDNGNGGHLEWQLLVTDPALAAGYLADTVELTAAQQAQYAYKTRLMNDVHMSHAMEFPYPQSMSNCATCHEGKLDKILTDAFFTAETCKSCHAVTASEEHPIGANRPPAMTDVWTEKGVAAFHNINMTCNTCHVEGSAIAGFSDIHGGYDVQIYTAGGQRYADAITVSIDSASLAGNKLTVKFSAAEAPDLAGLDVASIVPTVLVGLYGYDTKQFIIGPHERLKDDNGDGRITSADSRALEAAVGSTHPRITTVSAAGGAWEVVADLSDWAALIADGTVKRAEIGVMPALTNADGLMLAVNAPSRTFDLIENAFDDGFYSPVVKVADGCNNCHDALATTFHSPNRGGNVVVCRLCHTTKAGGSHLEMQSRSIDSYAHAIHAFQAFDIGDIDFTDPVEAMEYEHHIDFPFPTHGITNCEACHVPGTYNVPDQTKSLPGVLSAADTVGSLDRNIGAVPSYITGPAARACGACHKAELINEDDASGLASFFQHTRMGGYLVEGGDILAVIDEIMANFK